MNNRIFFLIFFIASATPILSLAQLSLQYQVINNSTNPPTYGPSTPFQSSHVSSDFGARVGYEWHKGVDYTVIVGNGDRNYHLITPVSGSITNQSHLLNRYKYLIVDGNQDNDFAYGHIFTSDLNLPLVCGDMVLALMEGPNNHPAIINLTTGIAIGPYPGTVKYGDDNHLYSVTPVVAAGSVIAPMGDSDADNVHLHLYRVNDPNIDPQDYTNAKNPLSLINHTEPDYTLTMTQRYNLNIYGSPPSYAGSQRGGVKVEVRINNPGGNGWFFTNSVMDVEEIKLLIKKSYQTDNQYQLIHGRDFESKISLGGRPNTYRYPSINYPPTNTFVDIRNSPGTSELTGIEPHAYFGYSYDYYFFSDIFTRIREGHNLGQTNNYLARCNDEAMYSDGIYDIYAKLERINGTITPTTPQNINQILVDNFIPYVRKVELYYGTQIYTGTWAWNGNNASLDFDQSPAWDPVINTLIPNVLKITVYFSEPVHNTKVEIPGILLSTDLVPISNTGDQVWEYTIQHDILANAIQGQYTLNISGQDYANNNIYPFNFGSPDPFSSIPIRQENGSWDPLPPIQCCDTKL